MIAQAHAMLTDEVYREYKGRFFGMFREPRERGWSAYNYFVGSEANRLAWPPERYAECIGSSIVAMLTGTIRAAKGAGNPFGTVPCHLPPKHPNGSAIAGAPCQCGVPKRANVELAVRRVDEGFAFAGLTDEWPLSVCLFSVKFKLPCTAALMGNSRPTKMQDTRLSSGRTPPSVYRASPQLYDVFADASGDGLLHAHVKRRFEEELRLWGVTKERCANEVCPQAKERFLYM